jgi:hypothetical protein
VLLEVIFTFATKFALAGLVDGLCLVANLSRLNDAAKESMD